MKITTRHKIAYKAKGVPGNPAVMELYRDEVHGHIYDVTSEPVALADGEPEPWVKELIEGTNRYWEGYIIPPSFEPKIGMVVETLGNPETTIVCYVDTDDWAKHSWIGSSGVFFSHTEIASLIKAGELQVREGAP